MNQFYKDFYRRWWWAAALTAFAQFVLSEPSNHRLHRMAPVFALFAGLLPMIVDSCRGIMRPYLSLPIRRVELASGLWNVSVLVPAFVTLAAALVSHAVFPRTGPLISLTAGSPLFCGFAALVTCGAMVAVFTVMAQARPGWRSLLTLFYVLIALLGIAGPILRRSSEESTWSLFVLGLAAVATWLGWRDRECLMAKDGPSTSARMANVRDALPRNQHQAPVGCGGWRFLLLHTYSLYFVFIAVIAIFPIVFGPFLAGISGAEDQDPYEFMLSAENPGSLGIWWMVVGGSLSPVFQIRLLRSLPMRTSKLVAVLLGLPLLTSFLTVGIYCGALSLLVEQPHFGAALNRGAQIATFFLVAVPVVLRWGLSAACLGILVPVFVAFLAIGWVLPKLITPLILLAVAPLSFWLTHRLLARSSAPYRGQMYKLGLFSWATR